MRISFLISCCLWLVACEPNSSVQQKPVALAQEIIYTKHARCRMDCRQIDESEVREIVALNHINNSKSDAHDRPCPTFAYEGYSHDDQHLRIVIAQCEDVWKVVTCIDLENEFQCNCR